MRKIVDVVVGDGTVRDPVPPVDVVVDAGIVHPPPLVNVFVGGAVPRPSRKKHRNKRDRFKQKMRKREKIEKEIRKTDT